MISRVSAFLFVCIFAFVSCKQNSAKSTDSESSSPEIAVKQTAPLQKLSPDFEVFYEKFHTDPAYQVEHIIWPLEGLTSSQDTTQKIRRIPKTFQKDQWEVHKKLDMSSGDFVQEWSFLSEDLLEETIRYSAAAYGMRRRFARMGGEWYLIYYMDMQDLGQ